MQSILTDDDYTKLNDGERMQEMIESPAWRLLVERIGMLRDELAARMVAGVDDHATYRELVGELRSLDTVLRIPGELVDDANNLRRSLSNDGHG